MLKVKLVALTRFLSLRSQGLGSLVSFCGLENKSVNDVLCGEQTPTPSYHVRIEAVLDSTRN